MQSSVLRGLALAVALAPALTLAACNTSVTAPRATPTTGPTTGPTAAPGSAQVRAVHGSPDAGPVDIYVYPQGSTIPSAPALSNVSYPAVSPYLSIPAGSYTVSVFAHGAASSGTPVATENVSTNAGTQYSIAVAGEVGNKTLQFVNFVEPVETAGQSALIVHHASPLVQSIVNPVGVGYYDPGAPPSTSPPSPANTKQLFTFSLNPVSGPAANGQVSGGEFFVSPIPTGLTPSGNIGFAAGAPSANGQPLASVATSATLAQLFPSGLPASGHISIFAVDTTVGAQLIGASDP